MTRHLLERGILAIRPPACRALLGAGRRTCSRLRSRLTGVGLPSALVEGSGLFEEVFADVLIAEAHQGVFAFQDGGEEGEVVGIGRVEAPIRYAPCACVVGPVR